MTDGVKKTSMHDFFSRLRFKAGSFFAGTAAGNADLLKSEPEKNIFFGAGFVLIGGLVLLLVYLSRSKILERTKKIVALAGEQDSAWQEDRLLRRVEEVFFKYQEAWSHFDILALKGLCTENCYQRVVLEMAILKRLQRQNLVLIPQIRQTVIIYAHDEKDNEYDSIVAEIQSRTDDILMDTESGNLLRADYGFFSQLWSFKRVDGEWKVDLIRRVAEKEEKLDRAIDRFARRNSFFFNPDFGRLIIPDRGNLFRKKDFKKSRAAGHVIGKYRDYIVEFYIYRPKARRKHIIPPGIEDKMKIARKMILGERFGAEADFSAARYGSGYVVAQVVLPFFSQHILIRRKERYLSSTPKDLKKFSSGSSGFDNKFSVFSREKNQVESFPLFRGRFMQKIADLPFPLTVEMVGSVCYFYVKGRSGIGYEEMLEILSWALDDLGQA